MSAFQYEFNLYRYTSGEVCMKKISWLYIHVCETHVCYIHVYVPYPVTHIRGTILKKTI